LSSNYVTSTGMTGFWSVLGEGSSGYSIVILSENQFPRESPRLPSPFSPQIHCHPERIHLSHLH